MTDLNLTADSHKALKAALDKLKASTDSVMLTPLARQAKDKEEKRFILQAKSFFDLKAYVMTGNTFPVDDAKFDEEISKDAFRQLIPLDSSIYQETKSGIVAIGSSCNAFYEKDLYNIVNAGSMTITWGDKTLDLLKQSERLNLYDYLKVLMDPKYPTPTARDQAWTTAYEASIFLLTKLMEEAKASQKQVNDIKGDMQKFRHTTHTSVLPKVDILVQKYSKPQAGNKSYLEYLNNDLATNIKKLSTLHSEYTDMYEKWKTMTGTAVGVGVSVGWIPVFGWIPTGALAAEAVADRKAWDHLLGEYNELQKENTKEAQLITFVAQTVKQCDGLLKKIDAAIDAIGTLSMLFQQQWQAYGDIQDSLKDLKESTAMSSSTFAQGYIADTIDELVSDIRELQGAAAGFMQAILKEEKGDSTDYANTLSQSF